MTVAQVAELYSVDEAVVEKALTNIANHEVLFLAVSGKIGAGKDTVAPLLVKTLGYEDALHESFARPLRDEVNHVIDCIRKADSFAEAMEFVKNELDPVNFEPVVEALYEDVKNEVVRNAYDRTPSTRKALQWWGTEVRRSVDTDYWVKKAMAESLNKLAEGTSIYVTDSRFPNEADCILSVGGSVVRLHVSQEEQARRIEARDGKPPAADALTHISETSMDDYPFPIALDTDVLDARQVADLAAKMIEESWR